MKKLFSFVAILFFGTNFNTFASHDIGGEIFYQQTASNAYLVTLKYYRDCYGVQAPLTQVLELKAPGCNVGRTITLNKVSQQMAQPYGPAILVSCSATSSLPNYEVVTYTSNLTFSAAEYNCSDWVLSIYSNFRGNFENISLNYDFYTETKLTLNSTLVNSSPIFDFINPPVLFVNYNQTYNLSMAATDPNGDSLSYHLVAPLTRNNVPMSYQPNTSLTGAALIQNPNPNPPYGNTPFTGQYAQLVGSLPANFTPTYPMPSILINWNGPPTIPYPGAPFTPYIWAAQPIFHLDGQNGTLKFHPSVYHAGTSPALGRNRYLVSILVEEFRKINGVSTKIGSIRRETMIQVFDNGPNLNPLMGPIIANGQVLDSTNQIFLRPGAPLNLQVSASDPNAADAVEITSNAVTVLPGATFTNIATGNSANGSISWTPTAAHVRSQPYYFQVMVRDNGNPLRGLRTETVAVMVRATGNVTGTKEIIANQGNFTAFPNPFTQELSFKFNLKTKAESIVIYNLLGEKIDEVPVTKIGSGEHVVRWEGAGKYAAGVYVAKLVTADRTVQTLKFTKLQ